MDTENRSIEGVGSPDEAQAGLVERTATSPAADQVVHTIPSRYHRDSLDRDEREIKDNVLRLGSMVSDQILRAIDALEKHDADIALGVIASDGRLNEAQRLITALVARTIATQQPVARDLRFMLALDHVAYDLERMGDHASSVAKQARKLAPLPNVGNNGHLSEMGRLVAQMVKDVLRALVDVNEGLAREVAARDDEMDRMYHATFAEMLDAMRADPSNVDGGARVLFAAHYLERIGDRVTNIAEDVVFLATGETEDLNT